MPATPLEDLKRVLREHVKHVQGRTWRPLPEQRLRGKEYAEGLELFHSGGNAYDDFIVPQLTRLVAEILDSSPSTDGIKVLEIGPGPSTILARLPPEQRRRITRYTAYEPQPTLALRLSEQLCGGPVDEREAAAAKDAAAAAPADAAGSKRKESPLPSVESPSADIRRHAFVLRRDAAKEEAQSSAKVKDEDHEMQDAGDAETAAGELGHNDDDKHHDKFDLVLFCHSMYGMKPKKDFIRQALGMLRDDGEGDGGPMGRRKGMVVVFHRGEGGIFGLKPTVSEPMVCHRTASFPQGVVRIPDQDAVIDRFASFIVGFAPVVQTPPADEDNDEARKALAAWRDECRVRGRRQDHGAGDDGAAHLQFDAPEIMVAFTRRSAAASTALARGKAVPQNNLSPLHRSKPDLKSPEARSRMSAAILKPDIWQQFRDVVQWALDNGMGLAVLGGSHSANCVQPYVVSVDMSCRTSASCLPEGHTKGADDGGGGRSGSLVGAGSRCTSGSIIALAHAKVLTVPLGSRPGVGAGLWLQGGIGHLARLHGLTCDAIDGALVLPVDGRGTGGDTVSAAAAAAAAAAPRIPVYIVGNVPLHFRSHLDGTGLRPDNEAELLWALRGAGTNFGIVMHVTFKAFPDRRFRTRTWMVPLPRLDQNATLQLRQFNARVASVLPRSCSADAYLLRRGGGGKPKLCLGVTLFESASMDPEEDFDDEATAGVINTANNLWGPSGEVKLYNSVELFDADLYMSGTMHGDQKGKGKDGGKTSSFKRCVFLGAINPPNLAERMADAVEAGPTSTCYLHLLQGGGAVRDVEPHATAFGCRDWDFACVITGVWPRSEDGSDTARACVRWVYKVVAILALWTVGVYGADLGPDPRDAALAAKAFGPRSNLRRLARLKRKMDPHDVLRYACPLPPPPPPRLIVLVTGESGAGKDHCADLWVDVLGARERTVRKVSISDATKREYAFMTDTDVGLLLHDRAFKEGHRAKLTAFYKQQLKLNPGLSEQNFRNEVAAATKDAVEVLIITGMREEAPAVKLAGLFSESKLLEVYVYASPETRQARGARISAANLAQVADPSRLVFNNDKAGDEAAKTFANEKLEPFVASDLERLDDMVRSKNDFPRPGTEFRHILRIPQRPGGLRLVTKLLEQALETAGISDIDAIVGCEAGGWVFATPLAAKLDKPCVLIRTVKSMDNTKVPPPYYHYAKPSSHISSSSMTGPLTAARDRVPKVDDMAGGEVFAMDWDALPSPRSGTVVLVDDMLASGRTLAAALHLLVTEAKVAPEKVFVLVVAELPAHGGRRYLRTVPRFDKVPIHSLLVFGGE